MSATGVSRRRAMLVGAAGAAALAVLVLAGVTAMLALVNVSSAAPGRTASTV